LQNEPNGCGAPTRDRVKTWLARERLRAWFFDK
jgi:hypothetical protein